MTDNGDTKWWAGLKLDVDPARLTFGDLIAMEDAGLSVAELAGMLGVEFPPDMKVRQVAAAVFVSARQAGLEKTMADVHAIPVMDLSLLGGD